MRSSHRDFLDTSSEETRDAEGNQSTVPTLRDKPGVLVVDDEHMVRILLQLGLERNGFYVWLAADGREALELYEKNRQHVAVVLLDVRMPGMDGPQTLDALRALNPEVLVCFYPRPLQPPRLKHLDLGMPHEPARRERPMLVLTRRIDEVIVIAGDIRVTVLAVNGQRVRLGITAPPSVHVARQELLPECGNGASSKAQEKPADPKTVRQERDGAA